MSDQRDYSSLEHFTIEKEINTLVENKNYEAALRLMQENSEFFDFKTIITDMVPQIINNK